MYSRDLPIADKGSSLRKGEYYFVNDTHAVILLSGGIDSTATLAAYKDTTENTLAVFLDYGQAAAHSEWDAAQNIAAHYTVEIERVGLGFSLISDNGEYFGRNALFVLTAAGVTRERPLTVALGIHSLTEYYDTTPLFSRDMQRLLNGYSGGEVELSTPFLAHTKAEVFKFAKEREVPLHLTYSCERQNSPACGICPSCQDRNALYGIK